MIHSNVALTTSLTSGMTRIFIDQINFIEIAA
jgi:hypothetical protein